jgi:hypothetical protein
MSQLLILSLQKTTLPLRMTLNSVGNQPQKPRIAIATYILPPSLLKNTPRLCLQQAILIPMLIRDLAVQKDQETVAYIQLRPLKFKGRVLKKRRKWAAEPKTKI